MTRLEAIAILDGFKYNPLLNEQHFEALDMAVSALSTDVRENVHGEWIYLDECSNSGYYCSNCQKKVVKNGWSETVKKIKFCPNCGADMRNKNNC